LKFMIQFGGRDCRNIHPEFNPDNLPADYRIKFGDNMTCLT
jgi:hypothetical protein